VVVEHDDGWGDAALARAAHGVRVVLARGPRGSRAERSRVWVAHAAAGPDLRVGTVADPAEIAAWDLAAIAAGALRRWGQPVAEPLLAVCANGRRDRCCGHAGGRLADALWSGPERTRVVTCTHLGGHRFAPTALLLPWGVLHGRLDLDGARAVLADAATGRTPTTSLRGHSTQSEPAQVAEAHARLLTGYRGLAPLSVAVRAGTGHHGPEPGRCDAVVTLPAGGTITVPLVLESIEQVASCGRGAELVARWSVAG
jgi:hypothetical protein